MHNKKVMLILISITSYLKLESDVRISFINIHNKLTYKALLAFLMPYLRGKTSDVITRHVLSQRNLALKITV